MFLNELRSGYLVLPSTHVDGKISAGPGKLLCIINELARILLLMHYTQANKTFSYCIPLILNLSSVLLRKKNNNLIYTFWCFQILLWIYIPRLAEWSLQLPEQTCCVFAGGQQVPLTLSAFRKGCTTFTALYRNKWNEERPNNQFCSCFENN